MAKAENQSQESGKEKDEGIKPLRMKQVTNIRGKLKRFFTRVGIIAGIGVSGGITGGLSARDGFRDITKFDPDWREKLQNGEINEEQETTDVGTQTPEEAEEETKENPFDIEEDSDEYQNNDNYDEDFSD